MIMPASQPTSAPMMRMMMMVICFSPVTAATVAARARLKDSPGGGKVSVAGADAAADPARAANVGEEQAGQAAR
jgi:hypothetical protein